MYAWWQVGLPGFFVYVLWPIIGAGLIVGGLSMAYLIQSDWNRSPWDDGPACPWWWGPPWYGDQR